MTQVANFNPSEHLIQLKSKQGDQDYLPVKWRLVWFRAVHPHGTIDTEEVQIDLDRMVEVEAFAWNAEKRRSEKVIKQSKGYARFRAVVTDGKGGRATGTKAENAANFADYIEKSETGAIGRALAAMGFGTQFTDEEFSEGERIVDSPVERASSGSSQTSTPAPTNSGSTPPSGQQTAQASQQTPVDAPATEQQIASIRKICQHVKMSEPENLGSMCFLEAKKLLQQLAAEYKEQRSSSSQQPAAQPAPAKRPTQAAQSDVPLKDPRLEMIARAKKRFDNLPGDLLWEDIKREAKISQIKDDDLAVPQVVEINKIIAKYEQKMIGRKAS